MRIVGGAETARLMVSTIGAEAEAVPDTHSLAAQRAREEGYREGYALATEQGRAAQAVQQEAVARLAEHLPVAWATDLERLEADLRETVIDLTFQIAEAITRAPVHSPDAVRSAVAEALALPLLNDGLAVRCHPSDAAVLQRSSPDGGGSRVRFLPDPGLEPGDAWITTPDTGDLDARLAQRLATIRERFKELALPGPQDEAGSQ